MRVQRILFPTDFSECAEQVFPYAQQLARRFEAWLYVLHAAPEAAVQNDPMANLDLTPESGTVRSATKDIQPIHSRITSSNPSEGILAYARDHHIDLIVMGTHGRTGIDHLLGGSVAEEVIRSAECPVITVRCRSELREFREPTRVLLPVDLTEQRALASALDYVRLFGTEVDVLHVIEESVLPTIYGVEPLSSGGPLFLQRTRHKLCKDIERQNLEGLTVREHVRIGNPGRRIVEFAGDADLDLIVMPTHARTGIGRLLMGSVAEKVVRLSSVPVLTFNRRAAEERFVNGRPMASPVSNGAPV